MLRAAILDDYHAVASELADWARLDGQVEREFFHDHLAHEDALVDRLRPFEVVVAMRERTAFPRTVIERLPRLKLLVATGHKNAVIDMEAAADAGVVVTGTRHMVLPPESASIAAEHTWALVLALAKYIPQADAVVRGGGWQAPIGVALAGHTFGILGLGHLGGHVARYANAFGMTVIAWSQNLTAARAEECGALLVEKHDLLAQSDVLSVHLTLSDRTRGLIGASELRMMKSSAILINTSRGPIVDEQALIDALREGSIAGAALDVFDREPLPLHHPLRNLPNVLVTPHSAFITRDTYRIYFQDVVGDIEAFLEGAPMRTLNQGVDEWERTSPPPLALVHGRLIVETHTSERNLLVRLALPVRRNDNRRFAGNAWCEAFVEGQQLETSTQIDHGKVECMLRLTPNQARRGLCGTIWMRDEGVTIVKKFAVDATSDELVPR